MKREIKIFVMLVVAILILVPLTSATTTPATIKKSIQQEQSSETTKIVCTVGNKRIVKEVSTETVQLIIDLAKSKKTDFLTIYNKYATPEEVQQAFTNVQPFFQSLVDNELTTKSVQDMNDLYYQIRDMIKKPKQDPRTLGGWNGLPTFITGNLACGIFTASVAFGFTVGTHTLLPTIGADLVTVWCGSGETASIGAMGFTTSTGPESGIILGFLGIMLATPIMITAFLLQIGFAGLYAGFGPSPF